MINPTKLFLTKKTKQMKKSIMLFTVLGVAVLLAFNISIEALAEGPACGVCFDCKNNYDMVKDTQNCPPGFYKQTCVSKPNEDVHCCADNEVKLCTPITIPE